MAETRPGDQKNAPRRIISKFSLVVRFSNRIAVGRPLRPVMSLRLLRSRYAALFLIALGSALSLAACGSDQPSPGNDPGPLPTGFGGAGGALPAIPSGGAGPSAAGSGHAGETTGPPPACLDVAKGQVALIDDFEDGNSVALPETGREGYWFTVDDGTQGTLVPAMEFVPVPGGANGTQLAAHVQASGYSEWGALFEVSLTYLSDGVHCPYNASSFAGVRFYLRGSGVIRVALVTPPTQDKEYGGTCDPNAGMVCYDTHTTTLVLKSEWTLYELPWSLFKQRGFGAPVVLQPDSVMAVQFAFDTPQLPIDFWLDEVSFWDGKITPPTTDGTAGAGGEGGGAGQGTTGGAAGAGGDEGVAHPEGGAGGTAGDSAP
jgi:hypothetical protein